jgi:predicted Zn-dependent protease
VSGVSHGFRARLFHPDFGNEAVEGRVFADHWKLWFEADGLAQEIPGDRLEADWEEHPGRICFRDSAIPDLRVFMLDETILAHPVLPQIEDLRGRMAAARQRRELSRRLRITAYFLGACVVLAIVMSWATAAMVRSIAARVPPEWERVIGEATLKAMEAEPAQDTYSNQIAQLTAMAEPLLQVLPADQRNVKFFIVEDPDPNAFALPGGFVVVNTGLLEIAGRPEEIQGVLAHELAHVTEKHLVRHLIAASGPLLIFGLFLHSDDGLLSLLSEGSGVAVFQGFSKEYEIEADEVGWKYLVAANLDPRGLADMFRKFQELEASEQELIELPQAFNSHPLLRKRIARLDAKWKKLARKDGFLVQTNALPKLETK